MNVSFQAAEPRRRLVIAKGHAFAIDRERPRVKKKELVFRKKLKAFFRRQAAKIANKFRHLQPVMKAEDAPPVDPATAEVILSQILLSDWADVAEMAEPYIAAVAIDASVIAAEKLGLFDQAVLDSMRTEVKAWAEQRAAELVGMKVVAGVLVPNPNAEWAITDSTRNMIAAEVRSALAQGLSAQDLADRIESSAAFSEERAIMVARTEIVMADNAGTYESYRAAGVPGKRWLTAQDDRVSDECLESEAAGVIKFDEGFPPDGNDMPPNHPNCRCVVVPVFEDEMNQGD